MIGKIYMLIGRSGSGKDSTLKDIIKKKPDLKPIIQYTTREKRDNEIDGVDYNFISDKEKLNYSECIDIRSYNCMSNGKTKTYVYFYKDEFDYYGKDPINYIIIGTIESYEKFSTYNNGVLYKYIVPMYLYCDEYMLLDRTLKREKDLKNPNYNELCRRFLADSNDYDNRKVMNIPNIIIFNIKKEDTIDDVSNMVINEVIDKKRFKKEEVKDLIEKFNIFSDKLNNLNKKIAFNNLKQKQLRAKLDQLEKDLKSIKGNNDE